MGEKLRTSEEWMELDFSELSIIDPDWWDRENFDISWNELITEKEFEKRLCASTVQWKFLI